ncbi:hypothetical protein RAS1_39830 [Phycisphaerae bacterium RAS1]|nr:hypothetical protein RAS1_39830 [Phycisphaerae bacterium RAS1]
MPRIEDIARAALSGDALAVRSLTQDLLASGCALTAIPRPDRAETRVLAVAAALAELLALRAGVSPPAWTAGVGALDEPLYLVRAAATMPRLRSLCQRESPEPLRRRKIYAPPDYLAAA